MSFENAKRHIFSLFFERTDSSQKKIRLLPDSIAAGKLLFSLKDRLRAQGMSRGRFPRLLLFHKADLSINSRNRPQI